MHGGLCFTRKEKHTVLVEEISLEKNCCRLTQIKHLPEERKMRQLGAAFRKPQKLFGPVKRLQNLEPCDYRAVLFTNSKDLGRLPSCSKFQACTLPRV